MRSVNRENGMIVKFHARGKGGGSGPVDYLLGRERNREGARLSQYTLRYRYVTGSWLRPDTR